MRTHTYDFASFCQGELVHTDVPEREMPRWMATTSGALIATMQTAHATVVTKAVPALSGATVAPSIDHAFDPVILMLQQMAFPVASIVLAWACLRAMIGHPAQGVDQAKWAIIGYLAMRYAPEILRHV